MPYMPFFCVLTHSGNGMTVLKVFPASAIQFAVYDSIKDALLGASQHSAPQLSTVQQLGAGMAAGAAATMATYPLEMLRCVVCDISDDV